MKTLCIYHGNCADGFGAAWVVRRSLGAQNVDFLAGHYGMPAPDVTDRLVIIVDFSFPLETLKEMARTAKAVLVLDHHKTAAEALEGLSPAPLNFHAWAENPPALSAVFDMHRSGAGITWDFLGIRKRLLIRPFAQGSTFQFLQRKTLLTRRLELGTVSPSQ